MLAFPMRRLLALTWLVMLAGCASIPPEAAEMSSELGKRISAIEHANLALLNKYFDEKRKDVDAFVEEEWIPVFAQEFFDDPKISAVWDQVVASNDPEDRLKFVVIVGPRLQKKINTKRVELIQPLDDLERSIQRKIRREYDQARAMNNAVTGLLLSASEVVETRNR